MYVCEIEGNVDVGGRDGVGVGGRTKFDQRGVLRSSSNHRHLVYYSLAPSKHRPNSPSAITGPAFPVDFLQTSPVAMRFKQAYPQKHCQNESMHRLEALQLAVPSLTFTISRYVAAQAWVSIVKACMVEACMPRTCLFLARIFEAYSYTENMYFEKQSERFRIPRTFR